MKKKLIISLIAIFLFLGVIFAIGALANESEDNPRDMINKVTSKNSRFLLYDCA